MDFYFYSQTGTGSFPVKKLLQVAFSFERKCQRKQGVGQSSFGVFFLRKFIQIEGFKSTFKTHLKECNHLTKNDYWKAISGDILKSTVEKSQTNVASATMNHLRGAIKSNI